MNMQNEASTVNAKAAGIAIAVSAITSIVAVSLDATASGKDAVSVMNSMISIQQSHQNVHMVAMACLGGLMFGFSAFAQRLGLRRAPVLAGLIAYGAGTMLMLLATIIDGFVSTDTAAQFVAKSPDMARVGYAMIQTMSIVLVDIAKVAWVFQSVAVLCWALALLSERGLSRAVGVIGLVAGALPAMTVFIVGSNMTDTVVVGILLLQGIWNLSAATLLLRGKSGASTSKAGQQAVFA